MRSTNRSTEYAMSLECHCLMECSMPKNDRNDLQRKHDLRGVVFDKDSETQQVQDV
jgi:hypothetical protein